MSTFTPPQYTNYPPYQTAVFWLRKGKRKGEGRGRKEVKDRGARGSPCPFVEYYALLLKFFAGRGGEERREGGGADDGSELPFGLGYSDLVEVFLISPGRRPREGRKRGKKKERGCPCSSDRRARRPRLEFCFDQKTSSAMKKGKEKEKGEEIGRSARRSRLLSPCRSFTINLASESWKP